MTNDEREKKAKLYEAYLLEYDKLAREVSVIESTIDPTVKDKERINVLKREMVDIEKRAFNLGNYHS